MSSNIVFCCVSTPRLNRLQELVPIVLPYVDRAEIVTGREDEEVREYLSSLGPKVNTRFYPWRDNFADSWNHFLSYLNEGEWFLNLDDDEVPSKEMLETLRPLVEHSNDGRRFGGVQFRSHDVWEGIPNESPSEYWRLVFMRYNRSLHFRGEEKTGIHQYPVNVWSPSIARMNEVYYHKKDGVDSYRNAARNAWICGIFHSADNNYQPPCMLELKALVKDKHPEVSTWMDFDAVTRSGNLAGEIKSFFVKMFNDFRNDSEYNEIRAISQYYFMYVRPDEADKCGFVK
jgi:hypothetical protein